MFERIDSVWKKGSIVSLNILGILIYEMVKGCLEDFKVYFLGMYFFNLLCYLKLLEIILIYDIKLEIVEYMKMFGEDVLGKGVVIVKDMFNFIVNCIGMYGLFVIV